MRNSERLLSIILAFLCFVEVGAQSSIEITSTDCFLEDCSDLKKMGNVEFGYLTVPENYDKPEGRQLKIAFAVIKSKHDNPETDPIMVFQGGWGLPMLNNSLVVYAKGFPIQNRDIIMFDYRGTGLSEPQLCDWLGEQVWNDIKGNLSNTNFDKNQTQRFNQCLDSLELKGIDYNQYGSNTKTKDAVMLAKALGYKSYNLHGISYGTRAILNFIKNAAQDSIKIRSVIMDSNSPMGMMVHGTMTEIYTDVLGNILNDCEKNPDCKQKFPNLKVRFIQFLESLDRDQWIINLKDGSTLTMNKEEMNAFVHQILYKQSAYRDLPILLEHLIARDDRVINLLLPPREQLIKEGYNALGAINFVYDHKYFRDSTKTIYSQNLAKESPFEVMNGYLHFYLTDNRIATDSLEYLQVTSDIPALILAGSYDPITPNTYSKFTATGFVNGFYVEAPKFGHGISPTKCGTSLMRAFIDNPNERPNNSCFESLGENLIPFRTAYYKNSNIGLLLNKLKGFDLILIISLLFICLISIVNTLRFLVSLFQKKPPNKFDLTFSSMMTFLFVICLTILVQATTSTDPFLLVFGLIKPGNYIFFLSLLIMLKGLVDIAFWIRNSKKSKWDFLTIISLALFVFIAIDYNLFPNF